MSINGAFLQNSRDVLVEKTGRIEERSVMDVLELDDSVSMSSDHTDKSFSGFSSLEDNQNHSSDGSVSEIMTTKPKKVVKSVVVPIKSKTLVKTSKTKKPLNKKPKKSSDKKKVSSDKNKNSDKQSSDNNGIDISKLTPENIESLRGLLGIDSSSFNDFEQFSPQDYPRMQIQIDANDISDTELAEENVLPPPDFTSMFDTDSNNNQVSSEFGWTMPKLKAPEMGEPVSEPLAKLVNVASTKQCEMDGVVTKYKVPSNCDLATPPTVNQEIWKIMNKGGHLNDKLMVDIQNLVAAGIGSVLKLVNLLKDQSLSTESKGVLSDTLTILGQTQYNLSMRRRYMIRPSLKKKYAGLCNLSTEVTKKLFGDHIDKEIKSCETLSSIGKDSYPQRGTFARGRGRFQQRRGGYGSYYQPRYQPYEQYRPRGAGSWRGSSPKRSIESSVGKLKLYVDQWKNYTNDPWIINAVSGYKIDFVKQPYQGKVPNEIPFDGDKWEIVNDERKVQLLKPFMNQKSLYQLYSLFQNQTTNLDLSLILDF
ncbi:hypothetical protein MAR_001849 [Mya arenaria]|uniref:Uncharacterized protein n=1 Tax=Mya arenaria TaxID=6604 RepID=A0ABY7FGC8_MYAAR|nr:hypothetical protein MAR_001849 [Mya arenaria]